MPVLAIFLLLISAFFHTTWNFLLKQAQEKYLATWWMVVVGAALSIIALPWIGMPARQVWPLAALSVLVEAIYFFLLSYAYAGHDFSLVYPLARGAAPAFLLLWSLVLLGEHPTPGGLIGLTFIILGLFIITGSGWLSGNSHPVKFLGISAALFTAVLISIYTFIDGVAVKRGPVLSYALIVFAFIPVPITPYIIYHYGWNRLKNAWIDQGSRLTLIGVLGVAAYIFALLAYSIAPLSYSGAIREVTVVIGALAGWLFLGEKLGGLRLIGALIIFAGILLISILG